MKRLLFSVTLGLLLSANFVFAQKTDADPTWKNKLYSQMGYDEKLRFIAAKSDEVLALFGRTKGDQINAEGLRMIQLFVDSYNRRISKPKMDSCTSKDWVRSDLTSVLKRAGQNAAVINEEFTTQKLPSQVGLYTAMIETEFCPCLQSATGALGMFQFLASMGPEYGLQTQRGASPTAPDDRCQPRLAARAASKYYKKMLDDIFGGDAVGYPLAIAAYNSGEGNRKVHIKAVSEISDAPRISFWVLIETQDELMKKFENESEKKPASSNDSEEESSSVPRYFKQFQMENINYVPKFFAAAIIGENPKAFGIEMPPLSLIR